MKKNFSLLATLIALVVTCAPVQAGSCDNSGGLTFLPYVGIDAQLRHLTFKNNVGNNVWTKKNYPQGNIYIGAKFNDYVGIEIGLEDTFKKSVTVVSGPGPNVFVLGQPLPAGVSTFSTNTLRMHGPHANLVGFMPLCEEYRLWLFGSVGAIHLRTKLQYQPIAAANAVTIQQFTVDQMANLKTTWKKDKTVLRLALGLIHQFSDCSGVRLGLGWENTNEFKNLFPEQKNSNLRASLKDSFVYSLGLFWNF